MNDRGSALLIVMWVIFLVGVIALGVGYQLELDAALSQEFREEQRAQSQAEAIFWWAVLQLQNDTDDVDSPEEIRFETSDWQADLGSVQGELLIEDEGSKINLNTVPETILKPFFKQAEAEDLLAPFLDWRDPDNLPRDSGAEEGDYAGEALPVKIRNGSLPVPQELKKIKNAKPVWEKLQSELTVWGPASLRMMDKEVLINILRESGMEIDDIQAIEMMQIFERLRKDKQIQSLDDLGRIHPGITGEIIAKLKPKICTEGTFNPNFLSEERLRALLLPWKIEPPAEQKLLQEAFQERSAFENFIHSMNMSVPSEDIWTLFTLESRIWRIEVSVKTAFRTCEIVAVVRRDRESPGGRWTAEILRYNHHWSSDKGANH